MHTPPILDYKYIEKDLYIAQHTHTSCECRGTIKSANIKRAICDNIPEIPDDAKVTLWVNNVLFSSDIVMKATWQNDTNNILGD